MSFSILFIGDFDIYTDWFKTVVMEFMELLEGFNLKYHVMSYKHPLVVLTHEDLPLLSCYHPPTLVLGKQLVVIHIEEAAHGSWTCMRMPDAWYILCSEETGNLVCSWMVLFSSWASFMISSVLPLAKHFWRNNNPGTQVLGSLTGSLLQLVHLCSCTVVRFFSQCVQIMSGQGTVQLFMFLTHCSMSATWWQVPVCGKSYCLLSDPAAFSGANLCVIYYGVLCESNQPCFL